MKRHYQHSYIRKNNNLKKIILGLIIIVTIVILLFTNRLRIQLMFKGYGILQQNIIMKLDDKEIDNYPNMDYAIDFEEWDKYKNQKRYYDYDYLEKLDKRRDKKEIVNYVDEFYQLYDTHLQQLGFDISISRELMKNLSLNDWKLISSHQYKYQNIKKYLFIKGCVIEDISKYIDSTKEPLDAILSISYPFINSQIKPQRTYKIEDPNQEFILVKKGFVLDEKYEPNDLIKASIPIAPDNKNFKLRKQASDALTKMYEDALQENLHLVLNSGYRSYEQQKRIYDEYFRKYDEVTASGLVAVPGSSEHQLGLGVDLTSQSVIDGKRMVFGDTDEYKWVIKNAYKYGFILRYPMNKSSITGTSNEPWHLRYVGLDAAKEIYEKNWTLEDYILHHGFTYDISIYDENSF